MEYTLQVDGVWKSYGKVAAVRGLNLKVPSQSVYGFIGPNGAGKSTTIRMMLGLQRPDQGSIFVFGRPLEAERTRSLDKIGALIETPSLYLHLTGRENLEVHRRLMGISNKFVDEALEAVDLLPNADKMVRKYSSGMKQRLGLAIALLGTPELLVLDEPTNGLDPGGVRQIRSLIRELPKKRGVTVFLSSHLLTEVEHLCSHYGIISQGRLRFEGTSEELKRRYFPTIELTVADIERATSVLAQAGLSCTVKDGILSIPSGQEYGPRQINSLLMRADVEVSHLVTRHQSLEETFFELTIPDPKLGGDCKK